MADLTQQQILDAYTNAGLTPVLVALGGNRSYNHGDTTIADFYGYHLESDPPMTTLHNDAENRLISFSVSTIEPRLEGDDGPPEMTMFYIDNWLWHTPVYTANPQYTNIRQQIIDFIQNDDDDIYAVYVISALKMLKAWRKTGNTKMKERGIRMALTVKYYLQHGTLNCDYQSLQTEYNIDTDQKIRQLVIDGRAIILNALAERLSWR